ncbi:MAG: lipopolysaccharide assembly protein LapA domain-containing protein [Ktedonobacterales bacterium]
MRALGCFLLGVVAAILVIAFGLFAVENGQTIPFSFLGNTMRMSLWLLVGIPAVIGFLLALLLVTPARAAGDRHGSALRGQHRALERDLADERQRNEQLRAENSRWQAQYQRVLTERDTLNTRLAAVQQTVTAPVGKGRCN